MSEATNISYRPFDGAAAWATLPAHVQARIGAAALEVGVAMGIGDHAGGPAQRAGEQAFEVSTEILREAVLGYDGVHEGLWWYGPLIEDGMFCIPSCLPVCRECGCSENDACEEGCAWHAEGLCTACVPDAGVEAAAPLQPGDVVVGGVTKHEPPLPKEEARAIVKGACRAVAASELAQPVQPLGGALRDLARAIDGMNDEIEGEA
ncbi:hypothetical protein ACLBXO_16300 [Methylobacterium sp. C33D]